MSRGWLAFMWAVIGGVTGQLVGTLLAPKVAFFGQSVPINLGPTELNLAFLVMTFGFQLKLTITGAAGVVLALWLSLRNG